MKRAFRSIASVVALSLILSVNSFVSAEQDITDEQVHPVETVYWPFDWVNWTEKDYNAYHPELKNDGYYIDGGYDLVYSSELQGYTHSDICWWGVYDKKSKTVRKLEFLDLITENEAYILDEDYVIPEPVGEKQKPCFCEQTVRIPNTINGYTVTDFYGSCNFKAFDVDPENQYFTTDGAALFSKDGKELISYAEYNPITEYSIPQGTKTIRDNALSYCYNLKKLCIPDSVKKIGVYSLYNSSVEEIVFESVKVKIDRAAFGYHTPVNLVCDMNTELRYSDNRILWDKVPEATGYEIYQKLSNGEYKLLKTTKSTSCKLPALKKGKKYTFAVKPVAVIPAANYNAKEDEGSYPESFTIEGTMSEDVVVNC